GGGRFGRDARQPRQGGERGLAAEAEAAFDGQAHHPSGADQPRLEAGAGRGPGDHLVPPEGGPTEQTADLGGPGRGDAPRDLAHGGPDRSARTRSARTRSIVTHVGDGTADVTAPQKRVVGGTGIGAGRGSTATDVAARTSSWKRRASTSASSL